MREITCAIAGGNIKHIQEKLSLAQNYQARGEIEQAEKVYQQVLATERHNRVALESLVVICLQNGRADDAEQHLQSLVASHPNQPLYCDRLATLLESRGKSEEAIACYRRLLRDKPASTNSRFNLARLLKRVGHLDDALQAYDQCLKRGIDHPEKVHTNISAIQSDQHRHEHAHQSLQKALAVNPRYLPALFNLALLYEEHGDWTQARSLFAQILKQAPRHAGALTHIAHGEKVQDPVAPINRQMKRVLRQEGLAELDREELLYALGKTHDDSGQFNKAFEYFQQANQCSQRRAGSYERAAQEQLIEQLTTRCDEQWLRAIEPVSEQRLIFICGMFRSGSTLLEQILAAHPDITAGGEIDYFQRTSPTLHETILKSPPGALRELGQGYINYLAQHFPPAARVSNKRPDNFLYLGLLRGLFPNSLFINIQRQPLDNCLSVFFQPLENTQAYANDLLDAGHYYLQYRRLMAHWQQLLGSSVLELNYENLVAAPGKNIARLLGFLGLGWHDDCLQFHQMANRVRTASVHQVRQPLYSSAAGRWHNYSQQLTALDTYLQNANLGD
jgi:tetratricopeptide (TPR) repeat protein